MNTENYKLFTDSVREEDKKIVQLIDHTTYRVGIPTNIARYIR